MVEVLKATLAPFIQSWKEKTARFENSPENSPEPSHLLPLPLLCSSVTPLWWSCDDAWLARHEGFPKPIIILSFWLGHTEEDTVNWIRHSLSAFHRLTAGYAGSGIKLIILNLKLVLRLTYSTI